MGHSTPVNGTATSIKNSIISYLKTNDICSSKLLVIGSDGTVINTGTKGSVIRLIEEQLNKPLQWVICQLHVNELPLRHLFQ